MASTGNLASIPRGKCRRKGSVLLAGHPNVKAISRRGTDRGTVLPAPLVQLGVVGGVGVGTSGAGQLDSDWSRIMPVRSAPMRYAPRRSSRESRTVPSPGPWRVASRATGAQGARARTSRCRPGLCGAARRGRTGYSTRVTVTVRPRSTVGTFNASKIVIMRKNGTFMRYNGRDPRNSRRRASQQGPVERRP